MTMPEELRERAASYRMSGGSAEHTAGLLDRAADQIEQLEAALTMIRDTLPIVNDNYSRHVFRTAANTLEPD